MKVLRASQTPERRREIARIGNAASKPIWEDRLLARVKVFADTPDQRILLAYRFGRMAARGQRWRERQRRGAAA